MANEQLWPGMKRTYALDDEIPESVCNVGNGIFQRNPNIGAEIAGWAPLCQSEPTGERPSGNDAIL